MIKVLYKGGYMYLYTSSVREKTLCLVRIKIIRLERRIEISILRQKLKIEAET